MRSEKLALLFFADLPRHYGLVNKYRSMAVAMQELGYEVKIFSAEHSVLGFTKVSRVIASLRGTLFLRASALLIFQVPFLLSFRLGGGRIFTEIPSPIEPFPRPVSGLAGFPGACFRWVLTYLSYKIAFSVSHRIYGFSYCAEEKYRRLSNWTDFSVFRIASLSNDSESHLRMICVGNISRHHGLDRIITAMKSFQRSSLRIVGEGRELNALRAQVVEMGLEKRVFFLGPLFGTHLDEAFEGCDLAISSLGFHRIGLTEGSPLKTREYAARGLPVVGSYTDTGILEGSSFPFLKVAANDGPIDLEEVFEFAVRNRDRLAIRREGERLFDVRAVLKAAFE